MPEPLYWTGSPPRSCDLCGRKLETSFVDGKTVHGPWANMCLCCHPFSGCGTGTGRGQKYEKQDDGRFLKVEG